MVLAALTFRVLEHIAPSTTGSDKHRGGTSFAATAVSSTQARRLYLTLHENVRYIPVTGVIPCMEVSAVMLDFLPSQGCHSLDIEANPDVITKKTRARKSP